VSLQSHTNEHARAHTCTYTHPCTHVCTTPKPTHEHTYIFTYSRYTKFSQEEDAKKKVIKIQNIQNNRHFSNNVTLNSLYTAVIRLKTFFNITN